MHNLLNSFDDITIIFQVKKKCEIETKEHIMTI